MRGILSAADYVQVEVFRVGVADGALRPGQAPHPSQRRHLGRVVPAEPEEDREDALDGALQLLRSLQELMCLQLF